MARIVICCLLAASVSFAQGSPDFNGKWSLDDQKSDDGEAVILGAVGDPDRLSPKDRRIAERLIILIRALRVLEIRQSASDIRLYDDADNVRIYYIDGKKHTRETPWGERLETTGQWEAGELHVRTDGKDLGEIEEVWAIQDGQLLYTVNVELEGSKEKIVVRAVYARAE
jgi:hypothetical protein